jgi:hypothetical protein
MAPSLLYPGAKCSGEVAMVTCRFLLGSCLLVGLAAPVRGDATARKAIERGIEAAGGEANLAKYHASTVRASGTLYLSGRPVTCTVVVVYQPPFQRSSSIESSDFNSATVVNGERGWQKVNRKVTALTREQLREQRETLHAEWVAGLVPLLRTKGYDLESLGETKVDGKPAVVVRVRHRDHRDVTLCLDKVSHLPVKVELLVKEKGKLHRQELLLRDYAKFGGVRRAREVVTRVDGKVVSSWVVLQFKAHEKKLPDSTFDTP